jgi:hypothetical protein
MTTTTGVPRPWPRPPRGLPHPAPEPVPAAAPARRGRRGTVAPAGAAKGPLWEVTVSRSAGRCQRCGGAIAAGEPVARHTAAPLAYHPVCAGISGVSARPLGRPAPLIPGPLPHRPRPLPLRPLGLPPDGAAGDRGAPGLRRDGRGQGRPAGGRTSGATETTSMGIAAIGGPALRLPRGAAPEPQGSPRSSGLQRRPADELARPDGAG